MQTLEDGLEENIERLADEILSPNLPPEATHIKRIQRVTLLAVQRFQNGETEELNLNN